MKKKKAVKAQLGLSFGAKKAPKKKKAGSGLVEVSGYSVKAYKRRRPKR